MFVHHHIITNWTRTHIQMACGSNHKRRQEKRGGRRKILTWAEKLVLAERESVESFLSKTTCGCPNKCLQKIKHLGDDGVTMVCDLRDQRFAGKSPCYTLLHHFSQCYNASILFSYPGELIACSGTFVGLASKQNLCVNKKICCNIL